MRSVFIQTFLNGILEGGATAVLALILIIVFVGFAMWMVTR